MIVRTGAYHEEAAEDSMILLLFVASVLVSVLLERQARQHTARTHNGVRAARNPDPPTPPKLKRTEAWLNVGLGFVLVGLSLLPQCRHSL